MYLEPLKGGPTFQMSLKIEKDVIKEIKND
jgi:hypothetical protein